MRKTLLFLSLLIALSAGAQNYIKEGTTWVILMSSITPNGSVVSSTYTEHLELCKDGDEDVLGLFTDRLNGSEFEYFVKTEGDKVFFKTKEHYPDQWFLMYDFGLKEKDICEVYIPWSVKDYGSLHPRTVGCVKTDNDIINPDLTALHITYLIDEDEVTS